MRFRLTTVAYVFALTAAGLAAFGGWGLPAAAIVLLVRLASSNVKPPSKVGWMVILALIAILAALILPTHYMVSAPFRAAQCKSNLTGVAASLQMHHAKTGHFPPAAARNTQGGAMQSWRLHLLPFLDQHSLYDAYRQDEAWDGPNNATTVLRPLEIFACPSNSPAAWPNVEANYLAITGAETAWPEGRGLALSEITDGPEQTIMLIEADSEKIAWAEPRDLSFATAVKLLSTSHRGAVHARWPEPGFFDRAYGDPRPGVHVAFADGSVALVPTPIPRDMAIALLTANAGDVVDMVAFRRLTESQLDYGKITGLVAFVALAILPSIRRWRMREAASRPSNA